MRALYLDCFSGAAGDMLVGALLDTGKVSLEELRGHLSQVSLPGYEIEARRSWRGGLSGTQFSVQCETGAAARTWPDVQQLLQTSQLRTPVTERALAVFQRLAQAEAKVHGCALDEVHFHEVGAVDSIIDIVAFCILYELLGTPRLLCSPLAVGEGFVRTEHGLIPVPAMATFELLGGVPIEMSGLREELVTPTGAALISTLCQDFGRHFSFIPREIGYGLGSRDRTDPPNAVRAVLCELDEAARSGVAVLETNLDDATGEEVARVMSLCLEHGALDVAAFPVLMKKGRPGHVLQVLVERGREPAVEELLLCESTTLGVRRTTAARRVLARRPVRRDTAYGEIAGKEVLRPDGRREFSPEFDELARIARDRGVSIAQVRRVVSQSPAATPEVDATASEALDP